MSEPALKPNTPRIAVVTPTFNRRELLIETVASVVGQTLGDWEMVIVDDGSSDGTLETLASEFGGDGRIRGLAREGRRRGASVCRNQGLSASSAPLVTFLDSDDLLAREALESRVAAMAESPEAAFLATMTLWFRDRPGDREATWNVFDESDDLDRHLRNDAPWGPQAMTWRRWAIESIGGWDESLADWQDWDVHVRGLMRGWPYLKLPLIDSYYRKGSSGAISGGHFRADRLEGRAELFVRTADRLREAGLLTRARKRMLAGLMLDLATTTLRRTHEGRSAGSTWRRCLEAGLPGPMQRAAGRIALAGRAHWRLEAPTARLARVLDGEFRRVAGGGKQLSAPPAGSERLTLPAEPARAGV